MVLEHRDKLEGTAAVRVLLEALRAMAAVVAAVQKKVLVDSMPRTEVVAAVVQVGVIGLTLLERELQAKEIVGHLEVLTPAAAEAVEGQVHPVQVQYTAAALEMAVQV